MEKCDFASVMQIIRGDLMDGAFTNQIELLDTIFSAYIQNSEEGKKVFFDAGQVNKWFNGLMKVNTDICQYYGTSPAHQQELTVTLEDTVLPCLSDQAMTVQRVYDLLVQDSSVSENKKQELIAQKEKSELIFSDSSTNSSTRSRTTPGGSIRCLFRMDCPGRVFAFDYRKRSASDSGRFSG